MEQFRDQLVSVVHLLQRLGTNVGAQFLRMVNHHTVLNLPLLAPLLADISQAAPYFAHVATQQPVDELASPVVEPLLLSDLRAM